LLFQLFVLFVKTYAYWLGARYFQLIKGDIIKLIDRRSTTRFWWETGWNQPAFHDCFQKTKMNRCREFTPRYVGGVGSRTRTIDFMVTSPAQFPFFLFLGVRALALSH
jgi:hypothetical protein